VVGRVCWLVRSLVRYFIYVRYARVDFSKSNGPIFMKFGMDVQHLRRMSMITFEWSRSKFKVKPLVIARTWFKIYLHQIWQSTRSNFGRNTTSDKIQYGGLAEVGTI